MKYQAESQGSKYRCAYCGEVSHTFVDPSQGNTQKYIEDCPRCIRGRPNELSISYDKWNDNFIIQSRKSQ
ncbi:CPXCG motif-containing cysteine-rich protein [Fodinibius sp.]|uniref:CPXCG motif-containing cysteine-rich protein n=1 Tax=Fodinibius sp. TaxID=1872440 RepID=UPI003A0FED92